MSIFLHYADNNADDNANAIAIPRVFYKNSGAKNEHHNVSTTLSSGLFSQSNWQNEKGT